MATKFTQEAHHAPPWGDLAVEKAGRQPIRRDRWWIFAFKPLYPCRVRATNWHGICVQTFPGPIGPSALLLHGIED